MSHRGDMYKAFDLGKYIIASLKHDKKTYELIADPKEAWKAKKLLQEYRQKEKKGQPLDVKDILSFSEINLEDIFPTYDFFYSVRKGDRVPEEVLYDAFGTKNDREIAARFLIDGEFAWTKSQRDEWLSKKKKQVINIIARNCINPQTKKPHPPARIEKALEEARVSIDVNKTAEEQIPSILKKIQTIIPIRMEVLEMAVKVPANYAAKGYNLVAKMAQIKNSEWQTDGSWIGVVSLPAGLQIEFMEKLNKLTHGRVQTKLLNN